MRLLFHCCCGPCATACVESLSAEGIAPTLFWYNPNIHPLTEYHNRREALSAFAAAGNLELEMVNEYGLELFLSGIGGTTEAPERCSLCYRMRLERTAAHAAEKGFDAFSTSLLISPWQRHDVIHGIGEELAAHYGLKFIYRDFRPLFSQSRNQARALGLYMQKYCGCMFSEKDAPQKVQQQTSLENVNPLFQRLALLTGAEALEKLAHTSVLIVGVGGVGSWCAEALVRSGLGKITIADFDTVDVTNVNRQLQATSRTLGCVKVEVLKQRLLEINPHCEVSAWQKVFSRENAAEFCIEKMDYVIDAIDSLEHKLDLIETSAAFGSTCGVKLFSSMGMAKKMDPTRIRYADIWETQGCALARLVRQGLRKRGFTGNFTTVYSDEQFEKTAGNAVGSAVTVTAAAGMALASLVLRDITGHR
ncbi:MAG: epoxyqueuosine reductase QueH [Treponema sp.]|jgi:tRNA A37 threonylcarbamoyladenosine dehydratase/predicted adenine nucleotide alpha hydrolase (AANH) superfamily ATPase|nr:epoxyqueuosine reductase QueH [Treponema sp.]